MTKLTALVVDTWRGLIQRRLWPVAALLVAALAAVPLLMTAEEEPVAPAPSAEAAEAAELAAQPLVTVASASERESARRVLGARKDPFKPTNQPKPKKQEKQEKQAEAKSSNAGGASGGAGSSTTSRGAQILPSYGGSGNAAPAPLPTRATPDTEKTSKPPVGSLSVRWGIAGDEKLAALEVERLDPLPTRDQPLLVYLGLTEDGRSAVFMLDAGLTVEGDGRCRPNPEDCQTLELKPGETEFIEVTGEDGEPTQFQLDLVKIHGRRAARVPSKDAAVEARATSRALRSLGHSVPAYRFDADAGTLERIDARN